jgi:SAM-dependent methyltransferase
LKGRLRELTKPVVDLESAAPAYVERIYEVPGFFQPLDAVLFARLFAAQDEVGVAGDVLEIGSFYGRAAILLGFLKDEGDVLHVCDLFEDTPPTRAGQMELAAFSGRMPTRVEFEAWFGSFHDTVPVIHQVPSSVLNASELGPRSFRFVHLDGSHVYEAVMRDIATAGELVAEGGVVAFDDFANVGYPGVAAALWPAVMESDLEPFACSSSKLYATLGRDWATRYRRAIQEFATKHGHRWKVTEISGSCVLSIWPTGERRTFGARAAGRLRRMARRILVTAPILVPDYVFVPLA